MNLIIDQGNTQIKIGVFDKWHLVHSDSYNILDKNKLQNIVQKYNISRCIISSVIDPGKNYLINELTDAVPGFIQLSHDTPLPFKVDYKTPETLGKDRVAVVAGGIYLYPGKDLLIIDAGTAITYELVTKDGVYHGGNIAPGLQMRYKALNSFTSRLPHPEFKDQAELIGKSTEEAIHAGIQWGMVHEIEGYINRLEADFPEILILFTGGDANFFVKKLKKRIFVHLNLVLTGLNRILEYNG